MSAWILQVNPNSFTEGNPVWQRGLEDWWCLSRRLHIQRGDTIFIWQAVDHRTSPPRPRGVYAKARVLAVTPLTPEEEGQIDQLKDFGLGTWVNSEERTKRESKPVSILIRHEESYIDRPLTKDEIVVAGFGRSLHLVQYADCEGCGLSAIEAEAIQDMLAQRKVKSIGPADVYRRRRDEDWAGPGGTESAAGLMGHLSGDNERSFI